ncbi:MAG: hypothetical protein ACXACU_18285 [Candidatus Hodarchaeales archaeon]|jgi:GTPase SAR1 family protein
MGYKKEYLFKISIVGTPIKQIGKMIHKFTGRIAPHPELGFEIATKKIRVDDSNVKLILPYPTIPYSIETHLRPSYYRGASAVFICFDKSNIESYLTDIKDIYHEAKNHTPDPKIPYALVGFTTPSDAVTTHEAKEVAVKNNMSYFELNPTDESAIENVMRHLTRLALAAKESSS